ncbi:class I SAM-dependent methyltransferase [Caenimonas terrae]|uniref:Class I SAM-dependent methyltransferase n=1 Tax=Caenimonas terrae TaxID=696074 RepID=A0ABW0NEV8_9BURK
MSSKSVEFFDQQFRRQLQQGGAELNPFELAALPYLQGRVLDFGCGLGNLAVAAARRGCQVVALDASPAAIGHLRAVAGAGQLPIEAIEADLRSYALAEDFDTVVSIGLLMFFDCPTALRQLASLQAHVRPGGIAVVNVLVEGTTYMDMFDAGGHCLFERDALQRRFEGWDLLLCEQQDFPAPDDRIKSFVTLVARRPAA